MSEDQQKLLAEELESRAKIFYEKIAEQSKELSGTHEKKEYTFSLVEKRRLLQQESVQMIAQQAVQDIIQSEVLGRLRIDPQKARVFFDVSLGKFIVWIRKNDPKPSVPPEPQS